MTTTTLAENPARMASPRSLSGAGLAAILTAYSLPVFNFFAVTVALGSMTKTLHASPATLQLVVAGFGVAYASTVIVGGRLGDNYGRRRILLIGTVLFVIASAMCALAAGSAMLVAARIGQGLAAALVAPQVLALIQSTPQGPARARAMGLFGAMAGLATSAAFVIGGLLVQVNPLDLGWRSLFWFEVVVALAVLLMARLIPEGASDKHEPLDLGGVVLVLLSVSLLIFPLTEGRAAGWPWWTWVSLALCVPMAALLVRWERGVERAGRMPLISMTVVRQPAMTTGLLLTLAFFLGFGGFMFVFALVAQDAAGWSPLRIGVALAPFALSFLVASVAGSGLAARNPAGSMIRGALLGAIGYLGIAVAFASGWPHFSAWALAIPFVFTGLGQGMLVVPLFATVLSGLPASQAGTAGGLLITTMQMALGIGSALVGTVFLQLGGVAGTRPILWVLAIVTILVAAVAPLAAKFRSV